MAWDFWKKLTGKTPGAAAPPEQQPGAKAGAAAAPAGAEEGESGMLSALKSFRGGMGQLVRMARDPKFRKQIEALVERMTKDGVDVKDKKAVEAWIKAHQGELGAKEQPHVPTFVKNEPTVGRNDPCPCGSGKKYKKCCELKEASKA